MLAALALISCACAASAAPLAATYLRANYLVDPTLADAAPFLSWLAASTDRGAVQASYHVVVKSVTAGNTIAWDSGIVASSATTGVQTPALAADSVYTWTVIWTDNLGSTAPESAPATFGTPPGPDAAWAAANAQWIGCTGVGGPDAHQLRLDFTPAPPTAGATITQARLYVSGIGWHIAYLNGARLGDAVLEPAFTNLRTRVLYTAHDVTRLVRAGAPNAFAALLGSGWTDVLAPWGPNNGTGAPPWNGSALNAVEGATRGPSKTDMMSLTQHDLDVLIAGGLGHGHTGYERRLRMWLSVRWSDGTTTSVVSSAANMGRRAADAAAAAWQCGSGALVNADLYGGCEIDARLETSGWTDTGYNFSTGMWADAVRIAEPGGAMAPAVFPPVRVVNELLPCAMWQTPNGSYVFDMCQNFAGGVRLTLPGPTAPGTRIIVRHAEAVMHPPYGPQDGSLYFGNLRSAEATDTYTTRGSATGEVFEPLFTWHGFRYVEVRGLDFTPPQTGVVTGLNFRTDVAMTGALAFPASANVLNQLAHAISWGQASNLMGNPSDCPQRVSPSHATTLHAA